MDCKWVPQVASSAQHLIIPTDMIPGQLCNRRSHLIDSHSFTARSKSQKSCTSHPNNPSPGSLGGVWAPHVCCLYWLDTVYFCFSDTWVFSGLCSLALIKAYWRTLEISAHWFSVEESLNKSSFIVAHVCSPCCRPRAVSFTVLLIGLETGLSLVTSATFTVCFSHGLSLAPLSKV